MTHDDIQLEYKIEFPYECWVQEKLTNIRDLKIGWKH